MIYFVLPAYNEEANISTQVNSIAELASQNRYNYEIIVVNDGSNDRTKDIIEKLALNIPAVIINHPVNKGAAEALRSGFKEALKNLRDEDIVISMDADNTQSLKTVEFMVSRIHEGYDIVSASMFVPGSMVIGIPFIRLFLSVACNMLYKVIFYTKGVSEYSGFYRAHSGEALKIAFEKYGDHLMETNGFPVMADMLIKYRKMPLFLGEAPMILRYNLKRGRSKLRVMPTILQHISVILKNLF